jgi:flagellar hook-basal body complex protein FliE
MPPANALDKIADAAFGSAPRKTESTAGGGDFASLIQQSLAQVNAAQGQADTATHQYQLGQNDVSLEDAMISMQKASISFQTTVQVRNKLVAAYNDMMNMQL